MDVVARDLRVAVKVALVPTKDAKVVVDLVVRAAVVVVEAAAVGSVVGDDEVVVNVVEGRDGGRLACPDSCDVREAIPAVECAICRKKRKGKRAKRGEGGGAVMQKERNRTKGKCQHAQTENLCAAAAAAVQALAARGGGSAWQDSYGLTTRGTC